MNHARKMLAAVSELRDVQAQLVVAYEIKSEAQDRMLAEIELSDYDWNRVATTYAFANAEMNRLAARIRVLKGRVYFRAQAA